MDIPSAVTHREIFELQRLAEGKKILEVGALLGRSTVALADVAQHVVSVDPHRGYPANNPRDTLLAFQGSLRRAGVEDKVTPIIAFHTAAFACLANRQFDGVFIDATGEYDLTLDIIRGARRLLRHHAWIAVHDCGHPDWPGAQAAVEHEFGKHGYRQLDRMAIIQQVWG